MIGCLYWLIGLYDTALRDPRYLDGWLLFAGMCGQLLFHIRKKFSALSIGRAARWMRVHIYGGYFVIVAFAFHTGFSLPDASFEWALWLAFVLVTATGLIGAYLSWSIPAKVGGETDPLTFERIPVLRFELARDVDALALSSVEQSGSLAISEFYVDRLHGFFARPRNIVAHLRGSRRPLARLCNDLDNLERYVEERDRKTLNTIRDKVIAKDNLDFHHAHQGMLQAWLFLHIPATWCLIVLTLLHVAVVYAYTSGVP